MSETRTYNNHDTLASINFKGAAIGNLTYGWDANKNKNSVGISGTMSNFSFSVGGSGYDDENRLVNWERSDNNLDQAWNLSLVGDWNSITENASTQSRNHGPTHEMLTAAGASVSHDVKGNMTLIPAVLRPSSDPLTIVWDFDNRLVSADVDNDSTADVFYKWDALGRRVLRDDGTTATVFVQSGQQTIADYTAGTAASSPTYTYVYASYIDEPVMRGGSGGLRYFHRNQQHSIIALTNGGGTITERYAYTAYGTPSITDASGTVQTSSADNNRYTYTGREWDESLSLYHYRARMCDSLAGRFGSRDPIGYADGYSQYQGFFAHKGTDPSGKCKVPCSGWCLESKCSGRIDTSRFEPLPFQINFTGDYPGDEVFWGQGVDDQTRMRFYLKQIMGDDMSNAICNSFIAKEGEPKEFFDSEGCEGDDCEYGNLTAETGARIWQDNEPIGNIAGTFFWSDQGQVLTVHKRQPAPAGSKACNFEISGKSLTATVVVIQYSGTCEKGKLDTFGDPLNPDIEVITK